MELNIGKALSPAEMQEYKVTLIPPVVFEVFNNLIAENLTGRISVLFQDEVVTELENRGLNREDIFKRGWLDVEYFYKKQGWRVVYDKPGYNETYKASWTFQFNPFDS